jgi:hypothetical protein
LDEGEVQEYAFSLTDFAAMAATIVLTFVEGVGII